MTKKHKHITQYGINYKTGRGKNRAKPKYIRRPADSPGGTSEVLNGCAGFLALLFLALLPIR